MLPYIVPREAYENWSKLSSFQGLKNIMVLWVGGEENVLIPWKNGERVLFLGEIENMRGHGIFVSRYGSVHYGLHLHDFRLIPDDEV